MNTERMILSLEKNGPAILAMYDGVATEAARWKPGENKWSLLEILNHLIDEERDDFRTRVRLVLEDPELDWPPIDPEGWARDRAYNARDLADSLAKFQAERETSVAWLRALKDPEWATEKRHPKFGSMRAGDLFAAWVAHDYLHLRQIANTHLAFVTEAAAPFSTKYAAP